MATSSENSNSESGFKRKFPRRRFQRAMGLLFGGDYLVSTGAEIGEGGLAITVPHEFAMGAKAVISFQIPGGSFICVQVELRNSQKNKSTGLFTLGCVFRNLKFDHKREIRSYVSARSELEQ